MSLPAATSPAILETILTGLAALFLAGAGGDIAAARDAARHMLGTHRPETEDELRLAASIVGFSFQALEALAQAAAPDIPITRICRLRGSAVSLSREASKAERRLGQLQKARSRTIPAITTDIQPAIAQPQIQNSTALIPDTGTVASAAKASKITWTQAYENRQRDIRIAASLKRAQARLAAQTVATQTVMSRAQPSARAM